MTLDAAGKSFLPDLSGSRLAAEVFHRYLFAREFVAGRRVLDIACGDGDGAALLAETAAEVVGSDASGEAVIAAKSRHRRDNLIFLEGSCGRVPTQDAAFDVVVRLRPGGPLNDAVLQALKRVMRPDALLILSAAEGEEGSSFDDAADSIRKTFRNTAVAGQHPASGSALLLGSGATDDEAGYRLLGAAAIPAAARHVILASDAPLPPLFGSVCLDLTAPRDAEAEAERRLRAREAEIARLRRQTAELSGRLAVIESSTIWRLTRPLRGALARFPRLRRRAKQVLRTLYHLPRMLVARIRTRRRRLAYRPLVSVIVPNFNHARFLPQRLDSILQQTYSQIELIILDDASTDDSAAVIERYRQSRPDVVQVVRNEANSGNVFHQWRQGIARAKGELIWICESDDFADLNFLERLVPAFHDESVMIGFGRVQFADQQGKPYKGLDGYRERAQPGIWSAPNVRPAKAWFDTAFGVSNVIPNVGGCLIRNQPVEEQVWQDALTYRILGDWYLYAMLARGGQIAYEPGATAYFRQHGGNTSVSSFTSARYYEEHERLIRLLRERWSVPDATVMRFAEHLQAQFEYAKAAESLGSLSSVFDVTRALTTERSARHVLIVILGCYLGGGEMFPIWLANALVRRGHVVSLLTLQSHDWNPDVRAQIDPRIAVYDAGLVRKLGVRRFLGEAGIDLIHSHYLGGEKLFFEKEHDAADLPYVVTLHGSYEVSALTPDFLEYTVRHVDLWVYLTQKNLAHLQGLSAAERALVPTVHIPNAVPLDARPFGATRAELGIGEQDLVFALASRAIREKGWEQAIHALELAQRRTQRRLVLLLCGAGEEADRLAALHAEQPNVRFLGYQDRVNGLYRLADCAILPSRFHGESFPLTIIQAMQVSTPIIATDVGEIARMLVQDDRRAGTIVPATADDAAFAEALAAAMLEMTDDGLRAELGRNAGAIGEGYSMDATVTRYIACYEQANANHARASA